MTHEIKRLLGEELADERPPPIGDLVSSSMRRGQRMRRDRNLLLGSSGAAAVAAIVVAGALLVPGLSGGDPQPAGIQPAGPQPANVADPSPSASPAPSDCAVAPSPTPSDDPSEDPAGLASFAPPSDPESGSDGSGETPAWPDEEEQPENQLATPATGSPCPPPREALDIVVPSPYQGSVGPATPSGAIELLTRLLPPDGETGGYGYGDTAGEGAGAFYVQVYIDRGEGLAMIGLSVRNSGRPARVLPCESWQTCYALPGGGQIAVGEVPGDCVGGYTVSVHRADGISVSASLARCLKRNDATSPPAPRALTTQEAVDLVLDPRWGVNLPVDLIEIGRKRFADLPLIRRD